MKVLTWSLIFIFSALNLRGILYVQTETQRLENIQKSYMPNIAEHSYKVGCMENSKNKKQCKQKAKQFKNEMTKVLGL